MERLLERVRSRSVAQLLAEQACYAAALAMGAVILLLILGTQILNWYWPVLVFGGAFGYGAWRFMKSVPSLYAIAQRIDRRLHLQDSLSTAFHFLNAEGDVPASQRRHAESLAAGLDASIAAPFELPRAAYIAATVTTVAFVLLGIRYGVRHNLDLRAPIADAVLDVFRPITGNKTAADRHQQDPRRVDDPETLANTTDDSQKELLDQLDKPPEINIASPDIPDVNDLSGARESEGKPNVEGEGIQKDQGEAGEKGEKGDPAEKGDAAANDAASNDQSAQGKSPPPSQQQAQQGKPSDKASGENNNMLDKMRDALQNLMNKMKAGAKGENQESAQKGAKQGQGQKMDKNGQQANQKGEGQPSNESQGDQQGESGEKAQNAQGQSADKSADKSQPDAKSGVGKSDGSKDVKYAEQLEAMGKISEILGKRAKDVQGEVMVEVSSGRQQLRTQYSNQKSAHQDASGEIHRDEVPLIHQQYVQQYFEEIRRQKPAAAVPPGPAPK